MSHITASDIRRQLQTKSDPNKAQASQRFFKTGPGQYGEGDRFLGLSVPQVRRFVRMHRTLQLPALLECLQSPWHEERLFALLVLVEQYKRGTQPEREVIFQIYLSNTHRINNWDLVDVSASQIVGAHLDPQDIEVLERLAASGLIWDRRIAIIASFYWIRQGVFDPTLRLSGLLLHDPHDLIHKAVGWMLREVGKRHRPSEEIFLREHCQTMPRTMLRYALEHFPEELRQSYLRGEV